MRFACVKSISLGIEKYGERVDGECDMRRTRQPEHLVGTVIGALVVLALLTPWGTAGTAAQGVEANTYQSPTYGYTLSWDEAWTVDRDESENDFDLLKIDTELSSLWFEGQRDFDGDAAVCLEDSVESFANEATVLSIEPREDEVDVDEELASGIYDISISDEDDGELKAVVYLECRTLIEGEAALEITHLTSADAYEDEAELVADVLDTLEFPEIEDGQEEGGDDDPTPQVEDGQSDDDRPTGDARSLMETAALSIDEFWLATFEQLDIAYESPDVVYYDDTIETACGNAIEPLDVGPHYCPLDSTIYMDVPFMEEFVAPYGEFAFGFVVAHEWGHHLQNVLEIPDCDIQQCLGGYTSLETELQADCVAGVWTAHADEAGLTDYGDAESAVIVLADLVGDPEGTSVDDPSVHGPGSLRAYWFLRGYYDGVGICFDDGATG